MAKMPIPISAMIRRKLQTDDEVGDLSDQGDHITDTTAVFEKFFTSLAMALAFSPTAFFITRIFSARLPTFFFHLFGYRCLMG